MNLYIYICIVYLNDVVVYFDNGISGNGYFKIDFIIIYCYYFFLVKVGGYDKGYFIYQFQCFVIEKGIIVIGCIGEDYFKNIGFGGINM